MKNQSWLCCLDARCDAKNVNNPWGLFSVYVLLFCLIFVVQLMHSQLRASPVLTLNGVTKPEAVHNGQSTANKVQMADQVQHVLPAELYHKLFDDGQDGDDGSGKQQLEPENAEVSQKQNFPPNEQDLVKKKTVYNSELPSGNTDSDNQINKPKGEMILPSLPINEKKKSVLELSNSGASKDLKDESVSTLKNPTGKTIKQLLPTKSKQPLTSSEIAPILPSSVAPQNKTKDSSNESAPKLKNIDKTIKQLLPIRSKQPSTPSEITPLLPSSVEPQDKIKDGTKGKKPDRISVTNKNFLPIPSESLSKSEKMHQQNAAANNSKLEDSKSKSDFFGLNSRKIGNDQLNQISLPKPSSVVANQVKKSAEVLDSKKTDHKFSASQWENLDTEHLSNKKWDHFDTPPRSVYRKNYGEENNHLPEAIFLDDYKKQLFYCVMTDDMLGVRALLEKLEHLLKTDSMGVLDNIYTTSGDNLLLLAIRNKNVDVVRLLLAVGADPDSQDKNNNTALDIAVSTGRTDIINAIAEMKNYHAVRINNNLNSNIYRRAQREKINRGMENISEIIDISTSSNSIKKSSAEIIDRIEPGGSTDQLRNSDNLQDNNQMTQNVFSQKRTNGYYENHCESDNCGIEEEDLQYYGGPCTNRVMNQKISKEDLQYYYDGPCKRD